MQTDETADILAGIACPGVRSSAEFERDEARAQALAYAEEIARLTVLYDETRGDYGAVAADLTALRAELGEAREEAAFFRRELTFQAERIMPDLRAALSDAATARIALGCYMNEHPAYRGSTMDPCDCCCCRQARAALGDTFTGQPSPPCQVQAPIADPRAEVLAELAEARAANAELRAQLHETRAERGVYRATLMVYAERYAWERIRGTDDLRIWALEQPGPHLAESTLSQFSTKPSTDD